MNRLKNHYQNTISYDLITKLNYKNIFEIPKLTKIDLNIGLKESALDKKKIIPIILLIEIITGQKGLMTKSRKNKILLKIKKGTLIGCKVTLREQNCYSFLEKLLIYIFPNIRDFKGIHLKEKNQSNISFNIQNVLNFMELEEEFLKFNQIPPITITINSNSKNNEELHMLLNSFNFPLMRKN